LGLARGGHPSQDRFERTGDPSASRSAHGVLRSVLGLAFGDHRSAPAAVGDTVVFLHGQELLRELPARETREYRLAVRVGG
jgi:hypothetical protein